MLPVCCRQKRDNRTVYRVFVEPVYSSQLTYGKLNLCRTLLSRPHAIYVRKNAYVSNEARGRATRHSTTDFKSKPTIKIRNTMNSDPSRCRELHFVRRSVCFDGLETQEWKDTKSTNLMEIFYVARVPGSTSLQPKGQSEGHQTS